MDFDPVNLEKAADSNEYEKFYESIGTLEALLGQNTGKVETQVQRIWPYGDVGRGFSRDENGRLFTQVGPEQIQLLFERLGFQQIGRWDTSRVVYCSNNILLDQIPSGIRLA